MEMFIAIRYMNSSENVYRVALSESVCCIDALSMSAHDVCVCVYVDDCHIWIESDSTAK